MDSCTLSSVTMHELANFLTMQSNDVGRIVIDKTGLGDTYSFHLLWKPGGSVLSTQQPAAVSDDRPTVFTALQEIGLRLQPATGNIPLLMIDHVAQPTEN
jgi:uncharacterized protein (TIGR03435 family)